VTLTNAQLTRLEHRVQVGAGTKIPVAAQTVTDMVAEIRSLRAQMAAVPWESLEQAYPSYRWYVWPGEKQIRQWLLAHKENIKQEAQP